MPIVANTKEFLDAPEASMLCLFLESSSQKVDSHIYLELERHTHFSPQFSVAGKDISL